MVNSVEKYLVRHEIHKAHNKVTKTQQLTIVAPNTTCQLLLLCDIIIVCLVEIQELFGMFSGKVNWPIK